MWFPDSADKTAQAMEEFDREGLPLFILANWRGFAGGQRDLFDGVLQVKIGCTAPSADSTRLAHMLLFCKCKCDFSATTARVPVMLMVALAVLSLSTHRLEV